MAAVRAGTARHREKEPIDLRDLTHVIEARSAAIGGRSSYLRALLLDFAVTLRNTLPVKLANA